MGMAISAALCHSIETPENIEKILTEGLENYVRVINCKFGGVFQCLMLGLFLALFVINGSDHTLKDTHFERYTNESNLSLGETILNHVQQSKLLLNADKFVSSVFKINNRINFFDSHSNNPETGEKIVEGTEGGKAVCLKFTSNKKFIDFINRRYETANVIDIHWIDAEECTSTQTNLPTKRKGAADQVCSFNNKKPKNESISEGSPKSTSETAEKNLPQDTSQDQESEPCEHCNRTSGNHLTYCRNNKNNPKRKISNSQVSPSPTRKTRKTDKVPVRRPANLAQGSAATKSQVPASLSQRSEKVAEEGISSSTSDQTFTSTEKCAACNRRSTKQITVNLKPLGAYRKTIKYLNSNNLTEASLVCKYCKRHLNIGTKDIIYKNIWAIFIKNLIDNPDYENVAKLVLPLIDYRVKETYLDLNINPNIRNEFFSNGAFSDITYRREIFFKRLGMLTDESTLLALHYEPFPNIRCPMGCCRYVEEDFECIEFHHVINSYFPEIKFFKADGTLLKARRNDWLKEYDLLKWKIKAGSIIDSERGLCAVVCKGHCDTSHQIIHQAANFISDEGIWDPANSNAAAPCVASTKMVRSARLNRNNASFAVHQQHGVRGGVSTVHLAPQAGSLEMNDFQRACLVQTCEGRPDIDEYIKSGRNQSITPELLDDYKKIGYYDRNGSRTAMFATREETETACASGSYLPLDQAIALSKIQNESIDAKSKTKKMDSFPTKVLPYEPDPIPHSSLFDNRSAPNDKDFINFSFFRSLVIHQQQLFADLFYKSFEEGADELLKELMQILSPSHLDSHNITKQQKDFSRKLDLKLKVKFPDITNETPVETCVGKMFMLFGLDCKLFLSHDNNNPEQISNIEEKYVIYTQNSSEEAVKRNEREGNFFMMVGGVLEVDDEGNAAEKIVFRHTKSSKFCAKFGKEFKHFDKSKLQSQNIYIYINEQAFCGLKKGEIFGLYREQRLFKCSIHRSQYLIQASRDEKRVCSLCRRKGVYKCDALACTTSLCRTHAKEVIENGNLQYITNNNGNEARPGNDAVEEPDDEEQEVLITSTEQEDDPTAVFDEFTAGDTPLSTDPLQTPTMVSDNPDKVPSCYLFNRTLGSNTMSKNGSVPMRHNWLMNNVQSKLEGISHPLLYPMGDIKPDIFYKSVDGAVVGALPNFMFGKYGESAKPKGLGSLQDHVNIRMRDLVCPIARDKQMIALYSDAIVNRGLNENAAIKVLKRGFEFFNKSTQMNKNKRDIFNNEWEIQKLAAQIEQTGTWDYFFTLTCNNNLTPGVCEIKKAIEEKFPDDKKKQLKMIESLVTVFSTSWERTVRHVVENLIAKSTHIFGKIKTYWYRYEFQSSGSLGNLPHVHGGLTLEPGEDKEEKLRRIACCLEFFEVYHGCESEKLLDTGFFKDEKELYEVRKVIRETLKHECKNANERCKIDKTDGKSYCRVKTHDYGFEWKINSKSNDLFSKDALEILKDLGLASGEGDDLVLHENLEGHVFTYPNNEKCRGLPTNGKLAYIFRSSTNVQLCSKRFCVAYLIKYASGKDEKRDVLLTLKKDKDNDEIDVELLNLFNHKISSASYAEKRRREQANIMKPMYKELPFTDTVWFMLNLPYVRTNTKSVFVTTQPYGSRTGILKNSQAYKSLLDEEENIKTVKCREQLESWRKFSDFQRQHIESLIKGKYCCDDIQGFSIRPPEYVSVDLIKNYYKWFVIDDKISAKDLKVNNDLENSSIFDGLSNSIKINERYLNCVLDHFCKLNEANPSEMSRKMYSFIQRLHEKLQANNRDEIYSKFVDYSDPREVVVVFNKNYNTDPDTFLLSHLIRFGHFESENQLFSTGNVLESYKKAGLIPDKNSIDREDVNEVIRNYILQELSYLPLTKFSFERQLKIAIDTFRNFFEDGSFSVKSPIVNETLLRVEANKEVLAYENEVKLNMWEKNRTELNLPEEIGEFTPSLQIMPGQSTESYQEKEKSLKILKKAIDSMENPLVSTLKSPWLVGSPGTGKTYLLLKAAAYSISKGYSTCIIAFTSQRAQSLGGNHFHNVFNIPASKDEIDSTDQLVNGALQDLNYSPVKLAYLKRLQVICFDEIGMLSREHLYVMDKILRVIKDSHKPFGGTLFIASGDNRQLAPINGSYVWNSAHLMTTVQVLNLTHLVRSMNDTNLQSVIEHIRSPVRHYRETKKVLNTLEKYCTIVPTLQDVPLGTLIAVGKNRAEEDINKQTIARYSGVPNVKVESKDFVRSNDSSPWQELEATDAIKDLIDKRVSEKKEIQIFVNKVYQLTFNNKKATKDRPIFSQGQLILIKELPDITMRHEDQRIVGKLLPAGVRILNVEDKEDDPTWQNIVLKKERSHQISIGKKYQMRARRLQFPLRHFVCSTIHRIIGDTCPRLAIKISRKEDKYGLWDPEQFLVVVSRVKNLGDLTFIGDWRTIKSAIRTLLNRKNDFVKYMHDRLLKLNVLNEEIAVLEPPSDIKIMPTSIPPDSVGFIFCYFSATNPNIYKITYTENLRESLHELNSGGSFEAKQVFRPYHVAFFICGFSGERTVEKLRKRFEILRKLKEMIPSGPRTVPVKYATIVCKDEFKTIRSSEKLVFQQVLQITEQDVQELREKYVRNVQRN